MFCVECGTETTIFKDGMCVDCYFKKYSFSSGPQYIDLINCPQCNTYKYKNSWITESFENILKKTIKDTFNISNDIKNVSIELDYDNSQKNIPCKITINGSLDEYEIAEKHEITVRISKTTCTLCSKKFGGYYEATLQIRKEKEKMSNQEKQEFQIYVDQLVQLIQDKGNKNLFITDIGYEKSGLDFFLSDKGAAQSIVKKIHEKYGGEIVQSSKNIGMKDGRQIYRMTYLIRLPPFKINDVLFLNKTYYLISSFEGKKVRMKHISTWDVTIFQLKDISKTNIVRDVEILNDIIIVSESDSEIQVMHPKTYKTLDLKKPKNFKNVNEKISIIKINDTYFLLPHKT